MTEEISLTGPGDLGLYLRRQRARIDELIRLATSAMGSERSAAFDELVALVRRVNALAEVVDPERAVVGDELSSGFEALSALDLESTSFETDFRDLRVRLLDYLDGLTVPDDPDDDTVRRVRSAVDEA